MAHVCEDDGTATTFAAMAPVARLAVGEAPQRWQAARKAPADVGNDAPEGRARAPRPEALKPAA